jgi:hypothetical protein
MQTSVKKMTIVHHRTFVALLLTSLVSGMQAAGPVRIDLLRNTGEGRLGSEGLAHGGEQRMFGQSVLLALAERAAVQETIAGRPVVITNPGAAFQDLARSGAMIIGMDRTRKGRLWGCWTGTGDKKDGYFLLATSDDGGTIWSKPRLAVGALTEPGQTLRGALVGNLWSDPKGRLWLFFDQQLGDPQGRITNWWIRCDDPDAAEPAWSEPVCFAEGCTLNKPTVLKSGDWLLPVSDWHQKTARLFASTDEGVSWKERGRLQFPDWEFDEHMTVELRDGRLWMLARTKGQPHESFSSDGGKTWGVQSPFAEHPLDPITADPLRLLGSFVRRRGRGPGDVCRGGGRGRHRRSGTDAG